MIKYPMQRIGVTAGFGTYSPFGTALMHYANDVSSVQPVSYDVCAANSGKIILSTFDSAGGNMVGIRGYFCEGYDIITRCSHLASRAVSVGNTVNMGDKIGVQGNTGSATTGQHLHWEVWVIPSDVAYSASIRPQYAVDPICLAQLCDGQTFIKDSKTHNFAAIPYPEPKCTIEKLPEGSYVELFTGVEFFWYPRNDFSPIVGGYNRSKKYITHFFPDVMKYDAVYRTVTPESFDGTGADMVWAGINTPWGVLWVYVGNETRARLVVAGTVPVDPDTEEPNETEPTEPTEPSEPVEQPAEPEAPQEPEVPSEPETPTGDNNGSDEPTAPSGDDFTQRSILDILHELIEAIVNWFKGYKK